MSSSSGVSSIAGESFVVPKDKAGGGKALGLAGESFTMSDGGGSADGTASLAQQLGSLAED